MSVSSKCVQRGTTEYLSLLFFQRADTLTIEGVRMHVLKNDLVLARAQCRYEVQKAGHLFVLDLKQNMFDPLFLSQIADCRILYELLTEKDTEKEYLFFHLEKHSDVVQYMNILLEEVHGPMAYRNKMIMVCLTALFTALDRSRQDTLLLRNSTMGSRNRFGRILQYIGGHYRSATLQEVADLFGYNPDYLSTRFKIIVGMTFQEKILSMRLEEARHLLITSNLSVEQITLEIGFKDKSWFMKKFKQCYGTTPAQYRRQYAVDFK